MKHPVRGAQIDGVWREVSKVATQSQPYLFPTPTVSDMGSNKTIQQWDQWCAEMKARHGNGNGHGRSLSIEAKKLLTV